MSDVHRGEGASLKGCPSPAIEAPDILTSSQLHSLFDILTHYETYTEVERFKDPATIAHYGFPFLRRGSEEGPASYAKRSSAPLLADLLRSIVLPIPGVRDLPPEFWHTRFQGVLSKLSEAELSESYDKGVLGTRKTLATAASAVHEAVSRGILGGVLQRPSRDLSKPYDRTKATELVRAWEDGIHELVYGNLVDELFSCATERPSLEEHSPAVQAAADYVIVHLATFIHHVFVLSPEGPYLLKLAEYIHKLIPYTMVRQTLRIGNAATMINGMTRLLLAKMGVGAVSNWFGLTHNADDGMNLLQRIISLVLSWDSSDFRKTVDKLEKSTSGPSQEHLALIKEYVGRSRLEHDSSRNASVHSQSSIIAIILNNAKPGSLESLSASQHSQCLEYYSALLAIRDREEITKALCRQSPDLFSQGVRDAVSAFDHIIRSLHEKIDLREHISAAETFISDFIETSRAKKTPNGISNNTAADFEKYGVETRAPSIEDYVSLIRRSRHFLYNWLHQVASQCPEIREDFRAWANRTIKVFRQSRKSPFPPVPEGVVAGGVDTQRRGAAGALSSNLQALYTALPAKVKPSVIAAVDAHASYLTALETLSLKRMQHILDDMPNGGILAADDSSEGSASKTSICGPGMFLSRWQQLLDDTVVAPDMPSGPLRHGKDVKGSLAQGKTVSAAAKDGWDPSALAKLAEQDAPQPPEVTVVVEALGDPFRELLVDLLNRKSAE
ncbi:PX-associated-domain-containing protein [Podospora aff. communis PSN243]|uniref:PX-associated-domain-containing protein n=1 Tax=Podospora aff. communis PSN243 TaxID=3040156 RepID=A0AAV9GN31_9PEZI|nr:PX-associated-domain-containing protein [Podospora aff. communis PSN243]